MMGALAYHRALNCPKPNYTEIQVQRSKGARPCAPKPAWRTQMLAYVIFDVEIRDACSSARLVGVEGT
jgi:hypothetical protein